MWKRFNWSKDQSIGNPVLIDTSMDEGYLETIPEVDSIKSGHSRATAPGLPELPFRAVEPLAEPSQQVDPDRTSSVYSQPSPTIPQNQAPSPVRRASSLYSAVSPLDTPRASAVFDAPDSPEVSPIEALPKIPMHFPKADVYTRSQLPVRRKVSPEADATITKFDNSPGWRRAPSSAEDGASSSTRWDDYSGEPTTSELGKPAAVKPGQQPIEQQYPNLKEQTIQILAGLRDRDPAKRKVVTKVTPSARVDPLDNPSQREPWKGASGRTTLVKPIRNNPSARLEPIQIPKYPNRQIDNGAGTAKKTTTSKSATVRSVQPEAFDEPVKPVAPLKSGKNNPRVPSPVTTENSQALQSPFQSPFNPNSIPIPLVTAKVDKKESAGVSEEPLTPPTPTPIHSLQLKPRSDSLQHLQPEVLEDDPSSRFSWTTYATTVHESPPPTPTTVYDAPPVPAIPDMPPPLTMRKRPVPSWSDPITTSNANAINSNSRVVVRKPVLAEKRRPSTLYSTVSNLDKSLPQCPPEIEALDKISTMEARMDEFARRKRNINKIIKELTTGVPTSPISHDLRTRGEIKKTVASLNEELADIIQEEHDVGLALHRAQRKRDKDDLYENPTGLWIKRVTS